MRRILCRLGLILSFLLISTISFSISGQAKPEESGATLTLASESSGGTQGNDTSDDAAISADGQLIAFDSASTNLVEGDTNGITDVFVHNLRSGITTRISVSSEGVESNNSSYYPSLSSDGRFVAFYSSASNLVAGDTNDKGDIFVHDRQTGETERVSVSSTGAEANDESESPFISADGRLVAFYSTATNLVNDDTNLCADVFVHDRQTGATQLISVSSDGTQGNKNASSHPSISADNQYVVFASNADNLVDADTNNTGDIFLHDRATGETSRVSISSEGTQANDYSYVPSISADGRYVTFTSSASNLAASDTNESTDVFVHDNQTGITEMVSVSSTGIPGDYMSSYSSISGDGRYVVFRSSSSNLIGEDTNYAEDIFIRDRLFGITKIVSSSIDGTQGNNASFYPSISVNGRVVVFVSLASNLVENDQNNASDAFVFDSGFVGTLFIPLIIH